MDVYRPWPISVCTHSPLCFAVVAVAVVLAVANVVWFVLLFAGGVLVPVGQLPTALGAVVELLPSGALAEGLRDALLGQTPSPLHLVVLAAWAVVAGTVASRTIRHAPARCDATYGYFIEGAFCLLK